MSSPDAAAAAHREALSPAAGEQAPVGRAAGVQTPAGRAAGVQTPAGQAAGPSGTDAAPGDATPVAETTIPARDIGVAVLYTAAVLTATVFPLGSTGLLGHGHAWPPAVSTALLLIAAAATVLRRRAPAVTLAVTGALSTIEIFGAGQLAAYFLVFEALWAPIVHGSRRTARMSTGAGAVLAIALLGAVLSWRPDASHLVLALLLIVVVVLTPLMWGWEVRHHREARRAAEDLVAAQAQLARERTLLAEERAGRAVDEGRRRIAQDLHDVVAGHLSAVSLHASLAGSLPDEAARSDSLTAARSSAAAALRDLRSVIAVLTSTEDADAEPATTLSWEDLAARLRAGEPADAARAVTGTRIRIDPRVDDPSVVDPAVRAALLRIGSEAVTNALRHGQAPRTLIVELAAPTRQVVLTCMNAVDPEQRAGSGLGRAAIADRARAVGGTATSGLVSGPGPAAPLGGIGTDSRGRGRAGRLWRVEVRVPCAPERAGTAHPLPSAPAELDPQATPRPLPQEQR
ncbi:sensor histidine kinase [Brachybacterium nesterenkovii]|uniref:sensor histidine kinase n=1 Tax=Brachybacterium nesterenkovii TaxID=47847 RepID=UPI000B34AF2F|nr:histidine kinase [Brachybacterium nesterenkovii]